MTPEFGHFTLILAQLAALTQAASGNGDLSKVDPNAFQAAVASVNTYIGEHC